MVVEQVPGVEHVKEVELGVDGDGGLHPGIEGRRTLLNGELLKCESGVKLNHCGRIMMYTYRIKNYCKNVGFKYKNQCAKYGTQCRHNK